MNYFSENDLECNTGILQGKASPVGSRSEPPLHFKSSLNSFLLTLKNEGEFKPKYMCVIFMSGDTQIEICWCINIIP